MQKVSTHFKGYDVYQAKNTQVACEWAEKFIGVVKPLRLNNGKTAVSFDIDDTLIDTKNSDAIRPVEDLYSRSEALGCNNVVITARPERSTKWSTNQLSNLRGSAPMRLYHMPNHFLQAGQIEKYKHLRRSQVERVLGHEILVNIGDQWTDIFGSRAHIDLARVLDTDATYVILPKTTKNRRVLRSNASIKLPQRLQY
jgi:hypothetical protein